MEIDREESRRRGRAAAFREPQASDRDRGREGDVVQRMVKAASQFKCVERSTLREIDERGERIQIRADRGHGQESSISGLQVQRQP